MEVAIFFETPNILTGHREYHIDSLEQDCGYSIVNALQLIVFR